MKGKRNERRVSGMVRMKERREEEKRRQADEPEPAYKRASTSTARKTAGSVLPDEKQDRRGKWVDEGRE